MYGYVYEIIFGRDEKGTTKNNNISESVLAEEPKQVVNYISERLKLFPEDELIGVIRRNPIIQILTAPEVPIQGGVKRE